MYISAHTHINISINILNIYIIEVIIYIEFCNEISRICSFPKNKENYIHYLNFDNMNIQTNFRIQNIIVSLVS